MNKIQIGKKFIGVGEPAYVIAEAGVNHNGSLDRAKELIKKAAEAGADAIKFQTYKAEKLVTKKAPRFWNWDGEEKKSGSQYDSYSKLDKFPFEHYPELIKTCEKYGIEFLSTPFDEDSADVLVKFGMQAIKVSSSDVTNLPFLKKMAEYNLPILLSVGASTVGEIEEAVETIEKTGNNKIVIMQCTLVYPTKFEDVNLRVINTLSNIFPQYPIGLSDHTLGTSIPPVAVGLGACVIEKHYTVDKTLMESADHWLSVDPVELQQMVESIRNTEKALGTPRKYVLPAEQETYLYDKRSLVTLCAISKGTTITSEMLTQKRPGAGIRPKYREIVIGRKASVDIEEDTTMTWDMI
jgi:sialic acid synthase SpsE